MILDYLTKSVTYISQCVQNVSKRPKFSTPPTPRRHPADTLGVEKICLNQGLVSMVIGNRLQEFVLFDT